MAQRAGADDVKRFMAQASGRLGLLAGLGTFAVLAASGWQQVSARPTASSDAVLAPSASASFTIGGNLTAPLWPGSSESLDMTFTNPTAQPLAIDKGNITSGNITVSTTQTGCAASNFAVTQGVTERIVIPAGQTVSLSGLGVPQADWPVVEMIETNTNQDACEGAPLTLTYSGIEAR
jgi:hypothetical protein